MRHSGKRQHKDLSCRKETEEVSRNAFGKAPAGISQKDPSIITCAVGYPRSFIRVSSSLQVTVGSSAKGGAVPLLPPHPHDGRRTDHFVRHV